MHGNLFTRSLEESMSQAQIDIIKGLYAAFARGDGEAVLAAFDPAVVWNEADNFPYADRNPYIGPAAIAEGVFARLAAEWDAFTVRPEEFLEARDTVVMLGRYHASYKATGAVLDAQVVHVWRLKGGKITGFQQYTDTAQAQRVTAARAAR